MTDPSPSGWSPEPVPVMEEPAPGAKEPLGDVVRRLLDDLRAYLASETARQKIRAAFIATNVRDVAIFGVIALFLAFATIVALLMGLIVILAPVIGPWWALLTVIGGALLVIAGLGLLIWSRIRRLTGGKTHESQ